MADGAGGSFDAPAKIPSGPSMKHCTACRKPVKDHVGPHGKERCIWSIVDALRQRVELLEKEVAANKERHVEDLARLEARHTEELARRDDLHHQRLDGLLDVIASLQASSEREEPTKSPDLEPSVASVEPVVDTLLPNSLEPSSPGSPAAVDSEEVACAAPEVSVPPQQDPASNPNHLVTFAAVASKPLENGSGKDNDGFIAVRKRRRGRVNRSGSRPGDGQSCALRGAQRVRAKCFFVSGISCDCSASAIEKYCRDRSVTVTGCYLLRSRAWGTVSAKLFVAEANSDAVVTSSFWPEYVCCRPWERSPPGAKNFPDDRHADA